MTDRSSPPGSAPAFETTGREEGPDLVALVGSRIAHDLNNPVGAIANGVELLALTAPSEGPELALIGESVTNARRRIKRFRIAFGAAPFGAVVSSGDIADLVAPGPDGRRFSVHWPVDGDLPRHEAKLVLLALMCLESALPWGGEARVGGAPGGWQIDTQADRMRVEPAHWRMLAGGAIPADLAPGAVHFALLAREAARLGRPVSVQPRGGDGRMRLTV